MASLTGIPLDEFTGTSRREGPGCEHLAALSTTGRREWLKDISMLCGEDYRVLRRARPGGV